jgi:pilus assembly protein Flp/PilA
MSFSKLVEKVKSGIAFYKDLVRDTEGASGIEYAIIAAMVAVVLAGFSTGVQNAITITFTAIQAAL